jgi:hypothetical protein
MLKDNVQAKANTHHVVDIVNSLAYKIQAPSRKIYGLNTHYWAQSTEFMSWPVLSRTRVLKAPFVLSRVLLDLGTKFCHSSKTWRQGRRQKILWEGASQKKNRFFSKQFLGRAPIFTTSSPHQQPPTCCFSPRHHHISSHPHVFTVNLS